MTVRLDPKLRYLAELAGRIHRRTLSSYIEWAISASIDRETIRGGDGKTIGSEAEVLWDVDEADRFVKLALRYPELLTHEEQVRWKLIQENGYMWRGAFDGPGGQWAWTVSATKLVHTHLREYWSDISAAASDPRKRSDLPSWRTHQSSGLQIAEEGPADDTPRRR